MKIAVTYENGQVFGHFGRTEQFKVYEVENNEVISSEVIGSNGAGHGALAGVLDENQIDILICGGIGGGAQSALASVGIEVVSGAAGDTDEVVAAYLKGELQSAGTTCDHHGEGHTCGHHEDGHHCGHHEEGGCGGCHGSRKSDITGKNAGKTCSVHYTGTFNDGEVFDSSYDRGEPLTFVCGAGMMIKGFDAAVADMEVGQKVEVHLMPEEAYGMPNPDAIITFPIEDLPGAENLSVGDQVILQNPMRQTFPVKIVAMDEKTITLDANHEMAGRELNFAIELVEVK